MNKHFIVIALLLFCVFLSGPAEARLTLGVVTGPSETSGKITSDQARDLVSLLAEKLQEDIVLKELSDPATLINWLDQFAMLDLALIPTQDVAKNSGRFLLVGQFDEREDLSLVCRQGVVGDLPQRAGRVVRESGFAPWRSLKTTEPQLPERPEITNTIVGPESVAIDDAVPVPVELPHAPPLSPGRVNPPQEKSAYSAPLPSGRQPTKKLVFGVFPDPDGLLQTAQQAESLAAYIEKSLAVTVKVREFSSLESFTEWFMRYRMVDLAVLPPEIARRNLGKDYLSIVKLLRSDRSGADSSELVIMRHGQSEELQNALQSAFLDMGKTSEGVAFMAAFKVSDIVTPQKVSSPVAVVEKVTVRDTEAKPAPAELEAETAEDLPPPTIEYPVPVEPVPPPEAVVIVPPSLPEIAKSEVVLSEPELPGTSPVLPEPEAIPAEPKAPPETPALPVEPVAQAPVIETDLPVVPEPPEIAGVPSVQPTEVVVEEEGPDLSAVQPAVVEDISSQDVMPQPEALQSETSSAPVVAPVAPPELVASEPAPLPEPPSLPAETAEPAPAVETDVLEMSESPEIPIEPSVPLAEVVTKTVEPDVSSAPPTGSEVDATANVDDEPSADEEQMIVEEVLDFSEAMPSREGEDIAPVIIDGQEKGLPDEEIMALLGEDTVAFMVAQPDIPQELRPPGVPIVRPGRVPRRSTAEEDALLVETMPEPLKRNVPASPPNLLPGPEPEPGIVYIVPFVSVMVPSVVNDRIFDQFVDILNQNGEEIKLQFLILKQGLQNVSSEWLSVRKYVTGEIYAYVEDAGSTSTELRAKARLTYRRPNQNAPAFGFEYPVKSFFDNNHSSIDVARLKLSEDIAVTLAGKLLNALKN